MTVRFFRKQRRGIAQMGHSSVPAVIAAVGIDNLVAVFGLQLAHASTIDGQVRTPTLLTTGDPLLVYTKAGVTEWAAHWTSDTNGNDAMNANLAGAVGRISDTTILSDGSVICVGSVMASKDGGGQQTLEIRNADGTIFKTFDTLAANPEDQCGIGTDGETVNVFIARYNSVGVCQWVRRFGHSQVATNSNYVSQTGASFLRVDVANSTVVHNFAWIGTVFPNFGTWTVGIGDASTQTEAAATIGQFWTIESEFNLSDGTFTGNYWVNRSAIGLDVFINTTGVSGVIDDGNPYLNAMRGNNQSRNAQTISIDRDGAPIAQTLPFTAAFNQFSAIWSFAAIASAGPDWVATLQRANTGDLLLSDTTRRALLGSASHYQTARYDNTFAGATFAMDSVQTGLAFTEAGLPTSATAFNGIIWKLDNDGLTGPLMKAVHKIVGADPCNFSMTLLNEAQSLVVGAATIPPGNTYRFDPGEASETDIAAVGLVGGDDIIVFLDESTLDIDSFIHSVATQQASNGSTPNFISGNWNRDTSPNEIVASAQITDGTTRIDINGQNLAQVAPLASEVMYFGFSVIDVPGKALSLFSGKLFAIGTVNTAAGVLTNQTAMSARRL